VGDVEDKACWLDELHLFDIGQRHSLRNRSAKGLHRAAAISSSKNGLVNDCSPTHAHSRNGRSPLNVRLEGAQPLSFIRDAAGGFREGSNPTRLALPTTGRRIHTPSEIHRRLDEIRIGFDCA